MNIPYVRSYFSERLRLKTVFKKPSLTRQDQAAMVNINTIYKKTQAGELVLTPAHRPEFGDFSQTVTYDEALNQIMAAQEAFFELPSDIRKEYNNDPELYYEKITSDASEKIKKHYKDKAKQEAAQRAQAELDAARDLVSRHDNTPSNSE